MEMSVDFATKVMNVEAGKDERSEMFNAAGANILKWQVFCTENEKGKSLHCG